MAKDIKLLFDTDLMAGDVSVIDGDLLREEGLETAVMISLFTDRRAKDGDLLDNPMDKRGWWGDQTSYYSNDQIGSRLWLLERAKAIQPNLVRAKTYITEALQWMLDDKVAQKIVVNTYRVPLDRNAGDILGFTVEIYKRDGTQEVFTFDDVWKAQLGY